MINTYLLDSQSELDYLFQSGQIDEEQYRLLDEFFSAIPYPAVREDERLLDAIIRQYPELEILGDSLDDLELHDLSIDKPNAGGLLQKLESAFSYRIYHDLDQDKSRRQLITLSGKYTGDFVYYLQMEKDISGEDYYFRKRYIRFDHNRLNCEAGNFNPGWGMGISLGYHSDFLGREDLPYKSALFPQLGKFNGIRLQYKSSLSPVAMLSYDRSDNARGRMAALGTEYRYKNLNAGFIGSYFEIQNFENGTAYSDLILGAAFEYKWGEYDFESEISQSNGRYIAYCFDLKRKFEKGQMSIAGWNYPLGYINPYGSGRANSDYKTIEIENTGLKYASRQNGEWGVWARSSYYIFGKHQTSISANYWSDAGKEEKFRMKISERFKLSKQFETELTYLWGDDNIGGDYGHRQHLRMDIFYRGSLKNRLRLSGELKRVYYSYGRRDYIRAELKGIFPIADKINSIVKFSRIDYDMTDGSPGYWLLYLSENIQFGDHIYLRAVMDSREGEKYNLIDSARFNLLVTLLTG